MNIKLIYGLAALAAACFAWSIYYYLPAFQNGTISSFMFALRTMPMPMIIFALFLQARRIRAREAGEA